MTEDIKEISVADTDDYKEGYKQAIKDLRIKITNEINKEEYPLSGLSVLQRVVAHLYEE